MTILNEALESFDPNDVLTIHKRITHRNWALRSFGALLESADFEKYFCRHEKNGKYKYGLNQIVELYVERQEVELEDIRQKSMDSPERIIIDGWKIYRSVSRGEPSSPEDALVSIRGAIAELNQVILQFGDEHASRAEEVKDKLARLREKILEKLSEEAAELYMTKTALSFDHEYFSLIG